MEESTPCQEDKLLSYPILFIMSSPTSSSLPADLLELQLGTGESSPPVSVARGGGILHAPKGTAKVAKDDDLEDDDPAVVLAQDVALVIRPTGICGALIGTSKSKFCLKLVRDCTVRTHQDAGKVALKPNTLVLRASNQQHAYTSGCLETEGFDNPEIMVLMGKTFPTRQDWLAEIRLYKAQEDREKPKIEQERKLLQSVKKRPRFDEAALAADAFVDSKPKAANLLDKFQKASSSGFEPLQPPLFRIDDDSDGFDFAENGIPSAVDLQFQVDTLARSSKDMMARLNELADASATVFTDVGTWMRKTDTQSRDITQTLGGYWHSLTRVDDVIGVTTDPDLEPTLWGSFAWVKDAMKTSVDNAAARFIKFEERIDGVDAKLDEVKARVTKLEQPKPSTSALPKTYSEFKDGIISLMRTYRNSISTLQCDIASLNNDVLELQLSRDTTAVQDPDLTSLRLNPPTAPPDRSAAPQASSGDPSNSVQWGQNRVQLGQPRFDAATSSSGIDLPHLADRVAALESRDVPGSSRGTDIIVSINGNTFRSLKDVEVWMTTHLSGFSGDGPGFGMFVDPYTVLHMVHAVLTQRNLDLKEMSLRKQMKMSQAEHYAVEAAQYLLPKIFTGTVSDDIIHTGGTKRARFKMLPKATAWEDDLHRDGLKYQLKEQLESVRAILSATINDSLYDRPDAKSLAVIMLSKSLDFISQLSMFISETYADIHRTHRNADEAWDLVCYVIEQIFKNQFSIARSVAKGSLDTIDMSKLGARILWSSLRTLNVADEYMSQSIANHPSVSSSYIRFLVSNTQTFAVAELKKTVEAQKTLIKALQEEVKGVKKVANSAKDKADRLDSSRRSGGSGSGSGTG